MDETDSISTASRHLRRIAEFAWIWARYYRFVFLMCEDPASDQALKRRGGVGATAAAIVVLVITAATGGFIYEGSTQPQYQSGGASANDIGGMLSSGLAMVGSGIKFASSGGLAQVQAASMGLIADTFTGNQPISPTCSATPKNSYIELTNSGSTSDTATAVTITYGGEANTFTISGACTIGKAGSPDASMYILFRGPSKLPNSLAPDPGRPYQGTVTLSGGARVPFVGSFYQGYPSVSISALALPASDFSKGTSSNSTCSLTRPASNPYVMLNNTGTVGSSFTSMTINWQGQPNAFPIVGGCYIGPDGTPGAVIYVVLSPDSKLATAAETGQPFSATLTPSFGAPIPFSGKFQ